MNLREAVRTQRRRAPEHSRISLVTPILSIALLAASDVLFSAHGMVLRSGLPLLLAVLLIVLPFATVTAPVVDARERGLLRLLATTPAARGALLRAQLLDSRAGSAVVIGVALVVAAAVPGAIELGSVGGGSVIRAYFVGLGGLLLAGVALSACGMALAAAVAARVARPARARAIGAVLPAVVLLTGGVLPLASIAPALGRAFEWVPTSALARMAGESLAGAEAGVVGGAILAGGIAAASAILIGWAIRVCAH
ncbi:hypothetical protein [Leucobacter chromiireducens]|uniref:hypothetical protein n=1 Tax=Leucobacter chromiireducens TaxID=283877 RepID=UPI003F813B2A